MLLLFFYPTYTQVSVLCLVLQKYTFCCQKTEKTKRGELIAVCNSYANVPGRYESAAHTPTKGNQYKKCENKTKCIMITKSVYLWTAATRNRMCCCCGIKISKI